MDRTIDFYFDYLSPYAYLAWRRLPEVCRPRGVVIRPRPVLFAGLLNHWGQLGPAEIPPKARHVSRECARFAKLAGIPFRSPRYHPFRPLLALRTSLVAPADAQARMVTAIFEAGWARGEDLGDAATIRTAIEEAGLNGDELLRAAQAPEVKAALREETKAATARGVFGIPTMCIEDELFWGLDQLKYVELYLDGNDPLTDIDLKAISSQGQAVVRPQSVGRGAAE